MWVVPSLLSILLSIFHLYYSLIKAHLLPQNRHSLPLICKVKECWKQILPSHYRAMLLIHSQFFHTWMLAVSRKTSLVTGQVSKGHEYCWTSLVCRTFPTAKKILTRPTKQQCKCWGVLKQCVLLSLSPSPFGGLESKHEFGGFLPWERST